MTSAPVRGRVWAVNDETVGATLAVDVPAGSNELPVSDVMPFDNGVLRVGTEELAYTTVDDEREVIVLATGTLQEHLADEDVVVLPETTEKTASVLLADGSIQDNVRIPYHAWAMFPKGIRAPEERERIQIRLSGGQYVYEDAWGVTKRIAGAVIDGPLPNAELSDGLAPDVAPVLEAGPFAPGVAEVRILNFEEIRAANKDAVEFDVAISLDPDVAEDGSATAITTSASSARAVTIDGDFIPMGSTVYFKVRARDADGPGPWSTEVSTETPTGDPYVTVGWLAAQQISVGQLVSGSTQADVAFIGRVVVGDRGDWDGNNSVLTMYRRQLDDKGQKVPMIRLDPDGSMFRGRAELAIAVVDALQIRGTSHVATGATLIADNGVASPQGGPEVNFDTAASPWAATPQGFQERGITWDTIDNCWLRLLVPLAGDKAGRTQVQRISAAGAVLGAVTLANIPGIGEDDFNSIHHLGNDYITVVRYSTDGRIGIARFNVTDGSFNDRSSPIYNVAGRAAIGPMQASGGRVQLAYVHTDGTLRLWDYQFSTASWFEQLTCAAWDSGWSSNIMYAARRNDGDYELAAGQTYRRFNRQTTPDETWTYLGDVAFDLGQSVATGGASRNAAGTWHASYGGTTLARFSNWFPSPTDIVWAKYALADGSYVTAASPIGSAAPTNRRRFASITMDASPGISAFRVYAAIGPIAPPNVNLKRRPEQVSDQRVLVFDPTVAGGTETPPTVSTFPGGSPGVVRSEVANGWGGLGSGRFYVRDPLAEDEAVNLRTLQAMIAAADTGWLNCTPLGSYNVTGGVPGTLQARYVNGRIYLRGGAQGSFTAGTLNSVAQLPAGIPAPTSTAHRGGAFGTGVRGTAFEITTAGVIQAGMLLGTSGSVSWLAIPTHYTPG